MTPPRALKPESRIAVALCIAVPLGLGLIALALGQDANWDLRNYHWYNPYALLTGRWEFDAGAGSYYNPLLDVPVFLAAQVLSAKTLAFAIGVVQGLNAILLFAMARALLAPLAEPSRTAAAAALAVVGMIGGGALALVGTTFQDMTVSLAFFGAGSIITGGAVFGPPRGFAVLFEGPARAATARVALAGLIMGIGVGLKLPMAIFAVGLCLAFLVIAGAPWRRLFLAFCFGVAMLIGLAASSGFWMWKLWVDFRNPFFPYFNSVFASPMVPAENFRDMRFVPDNVLEALVFPVIFSAHSSHVGEIYFRDLRILAVYLALLATPFVVAFARRRANLGSAGPGSIGSLGSMKSAAPSSWVDPLVARYLVVAAVAAFLAWMLLFSVYRYIVPLEMSAALLLTAIIGCWPVSGRVRAAALVAVLAVVTITVSPGTWGRAPHWGPKLVDVAPPPLPDHALVVMIGVEPLSYVIPELPSAVPVLRLQGYLTDPNDGDTGLNRLLRRRLAAHDGPIYLLVARWERATAERVLPAFALAPDFSACKEVASNLRPTEDDSERIDLCRVERSG